MVTLSHDKLFQPAIDPMKFHDFKMIIAVRTDLHMGKGKMAAQVLLARAGLVLHNAKWLTNKTCTTYLYR